MKLTSCHFKIKLQCQYIGLRVADDGFIKFVYIVTNSERHENIVPANYRSVKYQPIIFSEQQNHALIIKLFSHPGADPGFQVRGSAFKKIAPSGGRREKCWGISCEKSRFNAKKSYLFQF